MIEDDRGRNVDDAETTQLARWDTSRKKIRRDTRACGSMSMIRDQICSNKLLGLAYLRHLSKPNIHPSHADAPQISAKIF